jgi:hypothetical protein
VATAKPTTVTTAAAVSTTTTTAAAGGCNTRGKSDRCTDCSRDRDSADCFSNHGSLLAGTTPPTRQA